MVGRYLFKVRDGRTSLPEEWKKDLVPKQKHLEIRENASVHRQIYIDGVVKARRDYDFSDLIKFMYG